MYRSGFGLSPTLRPFFVKHRTHTDTPAHIHTPTLPRTHTLSHAETPPAHSFATLSGLFGGGGYCCCCRLRRLLYRTHVTQHFTTTPQSFREGYICALKTVLCDVSANGFPADNEYEIGFRARRLNDCDDTALSAVLLSPVFGEASTADSVQYAFVGLVADSRTNRKHSLTVRNYFNKALHLTAYLKRFRCNQKE